MERKIIIRAGSVRQQGQLNDTDAAKKIWEALPVEASANRWGDEIYFPIPVNCKLANPTEDVEKGDLAFWGAGDAFCIFFGPTPMSEGDQIKAASGVDVVGKLLGDPEEFQAVRDGDLVTVEKLKE